jgi:hypothetical protein
VAVDEVLAAAQRTTETNPLLPVPKQDAWFLLNAVLNEISEQFALGHLKRDMGMAVQRETYVAALTYEVSGSLKTRKVRAMLIQKKRLMDLPKECPKLESPHHAIRFRTLQAMAEQYQQDPGQFIEVEIVI